MKVGAVVEMFRIISAGSAVWAPASVSQATGWKPVQPNSVDEQEIQDALFLEDPDEDQRNHHRGGDAGHVPGDAEELLAADLGVEHHGQDQRQPGLEERHHDGVESAVLKTAVRKSLSPNTLRVVVEADQLGLVEQLQIGEAQVEDVDHRPEGEDDALR